MRARLGVRFATEPFAIAAIVACAKRDAVRIDVRLRHVGRWPGEGMVAKGPHCLLEQCARMRLDHRRVWILALARTLSYAAPRHFFFVEGFWPFRAPPHIF